MTEVLQKYKVLTWLLIIGAVYFFLAYLVPLLGPILVAMLFVTMAGPLLQRLQIRLHVNRQVGAVLLLLLALSGIGIIVWLLLSWGIGSLPRLTLWLEHWELQLSALTGSLCDTVGKAIGIDSQYLEEQLQGQIAGVVDYLQEEAVPNLLSSSLTYMGRIASGIGFLVTFLIVSILLAKEYDEIMNRLLDREDCHILLEVICGMIRYIATFVKAQLILMALIGALAAVVLAFAGVEYGALWGILAGILDALPFIGTGIVLVPLAVVQLLAGRIGQAVVCLVLYAGCAFLREWLEPRLIGKKAGIPPVAVVVSVYAGIRLFGLSGILKGPLGLMMVLLIRKSLQRRDW